MVAPTLCVSDKAAKRDDPECDCTAMCLPTPSSLGVVMSHDSSGFFTAFHSPTMFLNYLIQNYKRLEPGAFRARSLVASYGIAELSLLRSSLSDFGCKQASIFFKKKINKQATLGESCAPSRDQKCDRKALAFSKLLL